MRIKSNHRVVTWHLDTGRKITKRGIGVQQVFATLSPRDRSDITQYCVKVTAS